MDIRTQGRWNLQTGWLNMIDSDEIYQVMCDMTDIKNHLKQHFDLWGDNQPWHMFDKVHTELARIALLIDEGEK